MGKIAKSFGSNINQVIMAAMAIPNLTPEEEADFISRILKDNDNTEYEKGRMKDAYLKYAVNIVYQLDEELRKSYLDDLFDAAALGLTKAVNNLHDKYDPKKAGFATYAENFYIRPDINECVRSIVGFNHTQKKIYLAIRKMMNSKDWPHENKTEEYNRVVEELCSKGFKKETIEAFWNKFYYTLSMDLPVNEEDGEANNGKSLAEMISAEIIYDDSVIMGIELLNLIERRLPDHCTSEEAKVVLRDAAYLMKKGCFELLEKGRHVVKLAEEYVPGYSDMSDKEKKAVRKEIRKSYKIINLIIREELMGKRPERKTRIITRIEQETLSENITIIKEDHSLKKFANQLEEIIDELDYEELKAVFERALEGKEEISLNTLFVDGFFSENSSRPLRNEIISIALHKELKLSELNKLLKAAGFGTLYLRNYRDFILQYLLGKGRTRGRENESLIDRYISLCKQAEKIVSSNADNTVIVKKKTDEVNSKAKDTISPEQINEYLKARKEQEGIETLTSRANSGLVELLSDPDSTDKDFISWIGNNKELFTGIRERTYRVVLQMLTDYIDWYKKSEKYFAKDILHNKNKNNIRNINIKGWFGQLKEFSEGRLEMKMHDTSNVRKRLGAMIKFCIADHKKKSVPFDINRDMFISLAAFFSQIKDLPDDRVQFVNSRLEEAGFNQLDKEIPTDVCLEAVIRKGRRTEELSENEIIGYKLYENGLFDEQGIDENYRRSQYAYL